MRKSRKDPPPQSNSPPRAKESLAHVRRPPPKATPQDHYHQILALLKSEDIMEVMQGASQLSSELVMAQDDVLRTFPLDVMTPALVDCLHKEGIEDLSLYAINCLNQLADAIPNVCNIIVASGGISALCSKLMNLNYIDVSEQAIKLLDKLSYEQAGLILQEGGFSALLNVLDFFETATQRTILNILVCVARTVPSQELYLQQIVPALPILSSLLQYRSKETVASTEAALDFHIGLVGSLERICKDNTELLRSDLELMREQGLLQNVMELAQADKQLLPSVFKLLGALCHSSPKCLLDWLHIGGSVFLSSALEIDEGEQALGSYVIDALQLVENVLPPIPEGKHTADGERETLFKDNPGLLTGLGEAVIPKLFLIYERFVNKAVKQLTLDIFEKLVIREQFLSLLSPKHLADFISDLLASNDLSTVRKALKIAILLFKKVPESVAHFFVREGVIYKVEQLRDPKVKKEWAKQSHRETVGRNRIRHLLDNMEPGMEGRNMDQFLRFLRRREQTGEEGEPPLPDRLKRYMSDPVNDPIEAAKVEIDKLSFEVLLFHQRHGKDAFASVLNELKSIANFFFTTTSDSPEPHLSNLLRLMTSEEEITPFELAASKVVDAMWRWLICAQEMEEQVAYARKLQSISTRTRELLKTLLRDTGTGDSYFPIFVSLLTSLIKCTQQLPITLYESAIGSAAISGLRTLSQRAQIQLIFTPDPIPDDFQGDLRADLEGKNAIFSQAGTLGVTLEQYHTLDTIAEVLGKVRSLEDLEMFKSSFYRSAAEIRGVSQGQLNLIRQHLRLQQMLSENFDLAASLEDLGVRLDGNEELLKELQSQMKRSEVTEADLSEESFSPSDSTPPNHRLRSTSRLSSDLKAVLFVNHMEMERNCTVFEALNRSQDQQLEEPLLIHFKFVKKDPRPAAEEPKFLQGTNAILWQVIKDSSLVGIDASDSIHAPLRLLKFLFSMNKWLPGLFSRASILFPGEDSMGKFSVNSQVFQSQKLSALLNKQTQDVLAIVGHTAADWVWKLPLYCPFVFSFDSRMQLMKAGAISPTKGLMYFSSKLKLVGEVFDVRVPRQKVRVSRDHILESAMRVMNDKSLLQFGMLEFDYVDEEGTGAGPTLEFYSLTAREIRALKIWRTSGEECGLFPAPVVCSIPNLEDTFEFLGRFIGKAISEDKVIDVPLSPAFWKLVFGKSLNLSDLVYVDKSLHRYLTDLYEIVCRRNWIINNLNLTPEMRERQLHQVTYKGTNIVDLALNFTMPGYDLELKENGANVYVTLDSLEEYIQLVAEHVLMQTTQAAAFRRGLEVLIPIESISGFSGEELETLVCGESEGVWDLDMLQDAVVPAHGYTKSSGVYQHLLLVMSQLNAEEKRVFLQFITGSPRLPIGGFKALNPPLTVVRKDTNGPSDSFLPSVMT